MNPKENPKELVEQGYDRIADAYRDWAAGIRDEERRRYTDLLLTGLPEGARVLELGCGSGLPTTRELAARFTVTGVDISTRHVEEARRNVPGATFIRADMSSLDFPTESFDAVAAFYSIIHVPREEHPQLLENIAAWLRPGGLFVASMGARSEPGDVEQDWLGAPMYWSHFDGDTNRRLVEQAGLEIVSAQEHTADEDGVPVTFFWIVARKPE